jgi:hypothetical protein
LRQRELKLKDSRAWLLLLLESFQYRWRQRYVQLLQSSLHHVCNKHQQLLLQLLLFKQLHSLHVFKRHNHPQPHSLYAHSSQLLLFNKLLFLCFLLPLLSLLCV